GRQVQGLLGLLDVAGAVEGVASYKIGPWGIARRPVAAQHGKAVLEVRIGRLDIADIRVAVAESHLVLPAREGNGAGQENIVDVLLVGAVVAAGVAEQANLVHRVRCAVDVKQFRVEVIFAAGEDGVGGPVVTQLLLEFHKGLILHRVGIGPVRRGAGGNVVVGARTVGVEQRQGAPQHAVGGALVVAVTDGEQGTAREVHLDDAVKQLGAVLVAIQVGIGVLRRHHQAAANGGRQRAGDVAIEAHTVPFVEGGAAGDLQLVGGPLAHIVDGGGGIGEAGDQSRGALHHLDLFVDRGVLLPQVYPVGEGHAH